MHLYGSLSSHDTYAFQKHSSDHIMHGSANHLHTHTGGFKESWNYVNKMGKWGLPVSGEKEQQTMHTEGWAHPTYCVGHKKQDL